MWKRRWFVLRNRQIMYYKSPVSHRDTYLCEEAQKEGWLLNWFQTALAECAAVAKLTTKHPVREFCVPPTCSTMDYLLRQEILEM